MPLDREKFVKVMLMTWSENDNEALTALRLANSMLKKADVNWTGLVSGSSVKVKVSGYAPNFVRPTPKMTLKDALALIEAEGELDLSFLGLRTLLRKGGSISPADVKRIYQKAEELSKETN